ncbi:BCL2/adenovirus E1B interacting protein 1-like [Planoprotostelium fungivorum]|uniref:BCL2/adenovirus E1B interacting protein 1-like n=1 Tax=Planoprotostelium fungivorum TaxID=1890364 RepID=A0A2P6MUI2_9EUKA|nr:BCL2/adenovirus E1B interacting protein 1-like [Planoprotostelium fungivorum]
MQATVSRTPRNVKTTVVPDRSILSRIDELVQTELSIQRDIASLSRKDVTPKEIADENIRIKERIAEFHNTIKSLKRIAQEQTDDQTREKAIEKIQSHLKEEENLTSDLRKANILHKLKSEEKAAQERELLLGGDNTVAELRQLRGKQDAAKASELLSEDLSRIRSRMRSEAERSAEALKELERSSKVIENTVTEHKGMTGSIRAGRAALTKLQRREKTDRFLIMLALIFFFLVVLYILKTRLRVSFSILLYPFS